jgi:hypothetical protein
VTKTKTRQKISNASYGRDGGRAALSGFLYQMVGALGLRASGHADDCGSEMDALLSLITDDSEIVHELYDSDVGILQPISDGAKQGVVLVQFKYSSAGCKSTIPPNEYKDILANIHAAEAKVKHSDKVMDECYLVTNRSFSRDTKKICNDVQIKGASDKLDSDQNDMAKRLRTILGFQSIDLIEQLYAYGRTYGLSDRETDAGIDHLVGRLSRRTGTHPDSSVCQLDLVECLTGSPHSKPLIHSEVLADMERDLGELGPEPQHEIIERPDAERLYIEFRDRALIVCTGDGGTGKTAAVRRWANAIVNSTFVGVKRVSRVTKDWIPELVNQWRNTPQPSDNNLSALHRLERANPKFAYPLLHLNIDGIDERSTIGANTDAICHILDWFWREDESVRMGHRKQPLAKLIVTCRTIEDFANSFWYPNTGGSHGTEPELPPVISFSFFTDVEFENLLKSEQSSLPEKVFQRLISSVSSAYSEANTEFSQYSTMTEFVSSSSSENNYQMLRHPAIWEAFRLLSMDQQEQFLECDPFACSLLASEYIRRFMNKASARSQEMKGNDIELAFGMLAHASKHHATGSLTRKLWSSVLTTEFGCGYSAANWLYDEACSAGIIEIDWDKWRWRYPFVEAYLANLHERGAGL